MLNNNEVLERLMAKAGVENSNQYAKYLSEKYGTDITRQKINQFKSYKTVNLIHILLREALED
jgi:ribosomal protein S24E